MILHNRHMIEVSGAKRGKGRGGVWRGREGREEWGGALRRYLYSPFRSSNVSEKGDGLQGAPSPVFMNAYASPVLQTQEQEWHKIMALRFSIPSCFLPVSHITDFSSFPSHSERILKAERTLHDLVPADFILYSTLNYAQLLHGHVATASNMLRSGPLLSLFPCYFRFWPLCVKKSCSPHHLG